MVGLTTGLLGFLSGATALTTSDIVAVTCDGSTPSPCQCIREDGFETFSFVSVDDSQRCFTIYLPLAESTRPLPLMMLPQCYKKSEPESMAPEMKSFGEYGIASIFVSTPPNSTGNWDLPHVVNDATPQTCTGPEVDYMHVVFDYLASRSDDLDLTNIHISGHSQNSIFSAFVGFCFSEKVAGVFQASGGLTLVDEFKKYWVNREAGLKKVQGFLQSCDACQYWTVYPCYEPSRPVTNCFGSSTDDPFVWDDSFTRSTSTYGYDAAIAEGHVAASLVWGPPVHGHATGAFTTEWIIRCLGILPECPKSCWDGQSIDHTQSQCQRCSPTRDQLFEATPNITIEGTFGTPGQRQTPQPRPATSKCVHNPSFKVHSAMREQAMHINAVV